MPQNIAPSQVLDAVRASPGNRVKVAVVRHRRRPARQVSAQGQILRRRRGRLRLLRRRLRLGHGRPVLRQHDVHRLAQGLSRRAGPDRPGHAAPRALGRRRAVLPRRLRRAEKRQGGAASGLPAPAAEARAQARREAWRRFRCAAWNSSGSTSPRRRSPGPTRAMCGRRRSRRACSATRCCAPTRTAISSRR